MANEVKSPRRQEGLEPRTMWRDCLWAVGQPHWGGRKEGREVGRKWGKRKGRARAGHRSMCKLTGGGGNFCLIKSSNYSAKEEVNLSWDRGVTKRSRRYRAAEGWRLSLRRSICWPEPSPWLPLLCKNQGFLGLGCDQNLQEKSFLSCF